MKCPKCGLTTGEQAIQEHFESLEAPEKTEEAKIVDADYQVKDQ